LEAETMQTRRDFLKSAAVLSASPLLLGATAAQQTATKSEVFADFESGTYEGWTLNGNCWTKEPHTAETVPGITGFQGKRFLCTLHPKLGTNAAGKAVSREFTIAKPLITFLIGGGNYPGQACLNLVVDGKVVSSATGNDSAELKPVSWDVTRFVGQKAHFEVIDAVPSQQRGYVMVDSIEFSAGAQSEDLQDPSKLPYQRQITEMAEMWRVKYGLPGVWCGVIRNGKVVASVANGYRNIETKAPASLNDHLNVGSVSKIVTGSLIALFVAKGIVSYDTTVGQVFGSLAKNYPSSPMLKSTLRQLLAHTSALTQQVAFDTTDTRDGTSWRLKHVSAAVVSSVLRETGTVYEYNNAGAVIATAMVEALSSSSFEDWYYGSLGKSLGFTNPRMLDYSRRSTDGDVFPHYLDEGSPKVNLAVNHNSFKFAPQGSCSITLIDLCSFLQFTMFNRAGLPALLYRELVSRADERLRSDTSASWHVASAGYLWKGGETGRGEVGIVRADPRTKDGAVVYWNANYRPGSKDPKRSQLSAEIQGDVARLISQFR
jgi:CubicO group peptidase (beta-lactamase class C family)